MSNQTIILWVIEERCSPRGVGVLNYIIEGEVREAFFLSLNWVGNNVRWNFPWLASL